MIKVVLTIRRKSGLSRQEFKDMYEHRMVPIIERHVGKYILDYKRDYVIDGHPLNFGPGHTSDTEAGTDVFTEITIKDRATLDEMFSIVNSAEVSGEIMELAYQYIDMATAARHITEVSPES